LAEQSESWSEFYGYTPKPIDIDQGACSKEMPGTGRIWMYKRLPGLYLNNRGSEVPDELAIRAGFDLEADRIEASIQKEIKEQTKRIREDGDRATTRLRESLTAKAKAAKEDSHANPFEAQPQKKAGPSVEITDRNAKGDARGTKHFVMSHAGGPSWNVLNRATDEVLVDKVVGEEAIRMMIELQAKMDSALAAKSSDHG